jgi:hypothetical protein
VSRLEAEDAQLAAQLDVWVAEWEALEAEIAELERQVAPHGLRRGGYTGESP